MPCSRSGSALAGVRSAGSAQQARPPSTEDPLRAAPRTQDRYRSHLRHYTSTPTGNMRFIPLVILLACVAWASALARPQEDGEARAAPSRGLLKRGLLAKGKPTTTTTTAAPQEEAEYEDEEYPAEGEPQEASTEAPPSSTEGKKLVAGGVRPFRSNTDLLAALKRRRAQAAEAKLNGGQSTVAAAPTQDSATEAPVKANFNKKRFNTATRETNSEDAPPAPAKPVRGRFGKPAARSIQEEVEEPAEAAPAPARTGRTFSRRGGN